MANPFLPLLEYIPDGEPRVFGNRVYIYGSHDNAGSDSFCDYKLKVWSAPIDDLNNWTCHGDIFHTRADRDHPSDTDWTDHPLYAPDVVEKNGKYYLFCYILWEKGCVAVADKPEGPFNLLSKYKITSRRACVEKIEILPDGTIPQVEMTSLGFENSLNPYKITNADIACVLKGVCFITELDYFTRVITGIKTGTVIGYKYFDFGKDFSSKTMEFAAKVNGSGCSATIKILIDGEDGTEIGECKIGSSSGTYTSIIKNVSGRHSVFFKITHNYEGWFVDWYKDRHLFELESFVFIK